jgi:hypothetical protein
VQGLDSFLLEEILYCLVEKIGNEVRKWEKWEKYATRYAARLAMQVCYNEKAYLLLPFKLFIITLYIFFTIFRSLRLVIRLRLILAL